MPRGGVPPWRQRKEPVVDDWIMASVEQAGGIGRYDENGRYADLVIRGIGSREEADEYVRALYRCAHYLHRHSGVEVSMKADPPERGPGGYSIRFRAIDKAIARAHVLARYGPDRSRWPLRPSAKGQLNACHFEYDEAGRKISERRNSNGPTILR